MNNKANPGNAGPSIPEAPKPGGHEDKVFVNGIEIKWDTHKGICTFRGIPVALMWIDSTLAGLMSGVEAMVGPERFYLALQAEGRKSVDTDWSLIADYPDFKEGFAALNHNAAVAAWGDWQLVSYEPDKPSCVFRAYNNWEGLYQKSLGVCWGSGMLAGKLAGICSKHFKTNCWATQTAFVARGDAYDEFSVIPSTKTIEEEIEKLLGTDMATRADMAVALKKLREVEASLRMEILEREQAEASIRANSAYTRSLIEASLDPLVTISPQGKITDVNHATEAATGYERGELIGTDFSDYFTEPETARAGYRQVFKEGFVRDYPLAIRHRDGRVMEVLYNASIYRDESDNVLGVFAAARDVTERKRAETERLRAEAEIHEKEERLALATTHNGVGVWDWNLVTQEMIWDDSMYSLYHMHREDFIGTEEAWRRSLHPDDLERGDREVADAIAGIRPFNTEFRVVWPSGEVRHIKAVAKVFRDEKGASTRMLGINMDITDRKLAEDALREREAFLALIIENIPDMIFMKEAKELRYVRFNRAGEELLGYKREELLGKNDYEFFPREQADVFTAADRKVLESGQLFDIPEEPVEVRSGSRILHTKKLPILDAKGNPEYLLGISEDITERKKAEDEILELNRSLERRVGERTAELKAEIEQRAAAQSALQESEERFRAITANNPDHLTMLDRELRYTFVMNPQLGLTEQDMLGKTDYDFLARADADKLTVLKRRILASGIAEHVETALSAKDGKEEFFDGYYIPRRGLGGEVAGLIGYFRNVTERRRTEDHIQRLNDELQRRAQDMEEINKDLEAFSYSVSHDLRAPLRAIDGFSRIFLEEYEGKVDDEGRHLLEVVRENAVRMGVLIDDILQFSRSGRTEIKSVQTDMEGLAREVLDDLLRTLPESKLQVEIGHLPKAEGDRAMLRQVFANLLSNAIKFSGKTDAPRIEIGCRTENGEAVYYVKDNGAGFDMNYADRLFGVFQRLHTTAEFEGTGIGLAIVKRIVNRHGGRVWAESKVGAGATFYFALPLAQP